MNVFQTIENRRSIRKYTGEALSKMDLEIIIDAGRLAPTGGNQQPWEFVVVTDPSVKDRLKVAAQWMDKAGAIIAVVMDPSTTWWVEDGAAAIENILLAATSLGYGACWLEGWTLPREDEFKKLLHIPENKRLLTLIPVGVPAESPNPEKKPLEDILYWDKYGNKDYKELLYF